MATKNISFLSAKRREGARRTPSGIMRVLWLKDSALEMEFCDETI